MLAQDKIKVNAQIRPRLQVDNKDFNSNAGANSFTELRTRLGILYSPNENLSAFIQIQDSRLFGMEGSTLTDSKNIDLHQGYFTINNFFKLPLSLKIGRMELLYGSQRLIGPVGWHNVGRSFDGGLLTLNTTPVDIDFIAARTNESGFSGDSLDMFMYSAYGKLKVFEDYKIQPFIIMENEAKVDFGRYTMGFYMADNNSGAGFHHEIDAAYQFGTQNATQDISAFMLTYDLKYTFISKTKPTVSGGFDYLSGDDGKDTDKYKVFNTLYATNHKFYGYMDYFLNIPRHTYNLGLMDIHVKATIVPVKKLKLALAYHLFNANADYTLNNGNTSKSFGSEIDFTAFYGYSDLVKFVGGFSFFSPGDIFKEKKGEDSSTWLYLMAIVNL